MPKYTKEFKIKLVLEYLSGQTGGRPEVANKYNIPDSTLENWINKYNSGGFGNLAKKQTKNKFTSEFKLSVIQYRQINNISYRQTAEHFDITNGSVICNREKAYRERGLSGLEDNRGRPKKDMSKSEKKSKNEKPIVESEREELIRLREENKYLKMQILFEKKFQALLLEEEAEARKKQR
ncbi:transposase [Anaerococcus sp. mt242]|uniref:helix-turn-helix domain-containing protein n=1 Tax=Anaerococcus sp. mt242 TaxID=2661917 RepID=UPI00193348B1|nr:helix-turn-helix domain-containing protein [Anaerococcus sp. mt242]MBM0047126.1 transposase [Anaerococcus sp. mt242]